jgi:hypothetical protein
MKREAMEQSTQPSESSSSVTYADHRDIPHRMKFEYAHNLRDPARRAIEALQDILDCFSSPSVDVKDVMQKVADTICKSFGIDNAAIGLRSPDGMYRYNAISGMREEAASSTLKLVYSIDQFQKDGEYNGTMISKRSKLYLAEDNEYKGLDLTAMNRPGLVGLKRRSLTDGLEADYIDTFIVGPHEELLGWIEISGTRTGKLPDVATIRWVEAAASLIAIAIRCDRLRKGVA